MVILLMWLSLLFAMGSFGFSTYNIVTGEGLFDFSKETLLLTSNGKAVLIGFHVSLIGFWLAIFCSARKTASLGKETTKRIKALGKQSSEFTTEVKEQINDIRDQFSGVAKKCDDILAVSRHIVKFCKLTADELRLYPRLRVAIGDHYDTIEKLHNCAVKYDHNGYTNQLFNSFVKFWFAHFVDDTKEINQCIEQLDRYQLRLKGTKQVKHSRGFHELLWRCVREGGEIRMTSIVSADPYWKNPEPYLRVQKDLISNKSVKIYRYFLLFVDHKKELTQHRAALNENMKGGVLTRVVIFKNKKAAGVFLEDIGIVDNFLVVNNKVSNITKSPFQSREIIETVVYVSKSANATKIDDIKIDDVKTFFTDLENGLNVLKSENYENDTSAFIIAIRDKINEIIS